MPAAMADGSALVLTILHSFCEMSLRDAVRIEGWTGLSADRTIADGFFRLPFSTQTKILDEAPGGLGEVLWRLYRETSLWLSLDSRQSLSSESHALGAGIRIRDIPDVPPQIALSGSELLQAITTDGPRACPNVVHHCTCITEWAIEHDHPNTAYAFAHLAALLRPGDANLMLNQGRLARYCSDYPQAERCFRIAIVLGRRVQDWDVVAKGMIAMSTLARLRGNFGSAHTIGLRALSLARRYGSQAIRALALHDLGAVYLQQGKHWHAERCLKAAITMHPPGAVAQLRLANDLAYLWVESGHFEEALSVLLALRSQVEAGGLGMMWAGSMGRAAGGAGDLQAFDDAWALAEKLGWSSAETTGTTSTLLDLARGAASLGQWERAQIAATAALALAERIRDGYEIVAADSFLQFVMVHAGSGAAKATAEDTPDRLRRHDVGVGAVLESLGVGAS